MLGACIFCYRCVRYLLFPVVGYYWSGSAYVVHYCRGNPKPKQVMKRLATLLRRLADRLDGGVFHCTVRLRSQYNMKRGEFRHADKEQFKAYCVQELKPEIAKCVNFVTEGNTVHAELTIIKTLSNGTH